MDYFTPHCATDFTMRDQHSSRRRALHLTLAKGVLLLIVVGSFLFSGTAFAQGEGEQDCAYCSQLITLNDITCTSSHDCLETTGCASQTFTASCSGWYSITSSVICSGGASCSSFNACVNVYDEGGNIIPGSNCHVNPCSDCSDSCPNTVCLIANKTYTFYVCLVPCVHTGTCPNPPWGCYAQGKLVICSPPTTCP